MRAGGQGGLQHSPWAVGDQAWLRLGGGRYFPAQAKDWLWETNNRRAQMPKKPFPGFQAGQQVGGGREED